MIIVSINVLRFNVLIKFMDEPLNLVRLIIDGDFLPHVLEKKYKF